MTQIPVANPKTREEIDTYTEYALNVIGEAENVYNVHGILARDFFKLARSSQLVVKDLRVRVLEREEYIEELRTAGNGMLLANVEYQEALVAQINKQKDLIDSLRYKLRQAGLPED